MLKKILIGFGVLVFLFLVTSVVLGFNSKIIRGWCNTSLRVGIWMNIYQANWCDTPVGVSIFSIANAVSNILEPPIKPQIEVLNQSFSLYDVDENGYGKKINVWKEINESIGRNSYSQLFATIKNTGDLSVHGLSVKLKLYSNGQLVSEINPFDDVLQYSGGTFVPEGNRSAYGIHDWTHNCDYIPSGEKCAISAIMQYPPRFDKFEVVVEPKPYQSSLYADTFIPLELDLTTPNPVRQKWTKLPGLEGARLQDEGDYCEMNCSDDSETPPPYIITLKIKNNTDQTLGNILVESLISTTIRSSVQVNEGCEGNCAFVEKTFKGFSRMPSGPVLEKEDISTDEWIKGGIKMRSTALGPGESLKIVVRIEPEFYGDILSFKIKDLVYAFAWGEKTN